MPTADLFGPEGGSLNNYDQYVGGNAANQYNNDAGSAGSYSWATGGGSDEGTALNASDFGGTDGGFPQVSYKPQEPKTGGYMDSLIKSVLQPENMKTILGSTIQGGFGGIAAWLSARTNASGLKDAAKYKADREGQTIRDKVNRSSAMPELKRVTKDTPGKTPATGWKAPGLIASTRAAQ